MRGGHRITMFREPTWHRSVYSETPLWDIDQLFEEMELMISTEGDLGPPGGWQRERIPPSKSEAAS